MKKLLITAALFLGFLGVTYAGSPNPKTSFLTNNRFSSKYDFGKQFQKKSFNQLSIMDLDAGDLVFFPGIGYVWSKGYPIGINLGGLRMGFTPDDVRYDVSETEYRVPTTSWHWMSLIGVNLLGPVGLDLGLDLGLNNVERNIIDPTDPFNWYSKKKTYFSIAPLVGVNVWIFNVFAGYEFVFGFKDIQGWIFGAGLSLPVRTY